MSGLVSAGLWRVRPALVWRKVGHVNMQQVDSVGGIHLCWHGDAGIDAAFCLERLTTCRRGFMVAAWLP